MAKHTGPTEVVKIGGFFPNPTSKGTRVRLAVNFYGKLVLVDLRKWYLKDDDYLPSSKGISLDVPMLDGKYDVTVLDKTISLLDRALVSAPSYFSGDGLKKAQQLKVGGFFPLKHSNRTKIRVSIDYHSVTLLDLRKWYLNADDEYAPGPKGISLVIEKSAGVYTATPISKTINLLQKARDHLTQV